MRRRPGETGRGPALTLPGFADEYRCLLREFVYDQSESLLLQANELGKRALDNITLLDVASTHSDALRRILDDFPESEHLVLIEKTLRVFLECLAGYELSVRGFWHQLEEARRKSEEDVKAIFASARDGVLLFDQSGSLVDCNQSFADLFALRREDLAGRDIPSGVINASAMEQLSDKGYFDEYETQFQRSDGSKIVVTLSGARIGSGPGGDRWRAFAFARDVTERRRFLDALRTSEEKYRTLYESSADGIVSMDLEGNITHANQAYLAMTGYSLEEVIGLSYKRLTARKWHDLEESVIETEVLARGYSRLYEKEYVRKDGSLVPVSIRRWLMRDTEAEPTGIWSIVRDITRQKQSERELRRKNAELQGFSHSVCHDLRGPLTAIVLANGSLKDLADESDIDLIKENLAEAVETIGRSLERAYALMDDLLALAESGQEPRELADVAVTELVRGIREEHAGAFEARGAVLKTSGDLGVVRASETHLYQLFSNLIMNAVHHNDAENPVVEVAYHGRGENGCHAYTVRDNGPGIPEEDIQQVFTAFFKKGRSSRTGVGLAIVEKVITVYGGAVSVRNDDGACFEFTLTDWKG